MSMEVISCLVQLWGLFATVVFAAICKKMKNSIIAGIIIMFFANLVGQLIAGGGPGLLLGSLILPVYGVVAAWLTVRIVERIKRRSRSQNEDEKNKNNEYEDNRGN